MYPSMHSPVRPTSPQTKRGSGAGATANDRQSTLRSRQLVSEEPMLKMHSDKQKETMRVVTIF
eukprot:11186603-Lingulodinium_polyedra.AAC.1